MVRASILAEIMKIACASIWSNKLRTFLTLLGIIVGVASVMVRVRRYQRSRGVCHQPDFECSGEQFLHARSIRSIR